MEDQYFPSRKTGGKGPVMNLLLYAKPADGAGGRLQKVIQSFALQEPEIYRTIDGFSRRLRRPRRDVTVVVILTTTDEELLEIYSMRDLLEDIRVILILPGDDDHTIAIGHKLRPRFLSYADGNFRDVGAVLRKMIGLARYNPNNVEPSTLSFGYDAWREE